MLGRIGLGGADELELLGLAGLLILDVDDGADPDLVSVSMCFSSITAARRSLS